MQAAAFIDRDGVINEELHHVHRIEDFHLLPGAVEGLSTLAAAGFALVVVTNQGGIAKGLYTPADFHTLTAHMRTHLASRGVQLAGVYHCPHHPEGTVPEWSTACDCRKPQPGLLLQATRELGLDPSRSVMIGDKLSDMQAARRAGVACGVLVESGHALPADAQAECDYRCAGLAEAARWVVSSGCLGNGRQGSRSAQAAHP